MARRPASRRPPTDRKSKPANGIAVEARIQSMSSTVHSAEGQFGATTDEPARVHKQYPPDGTTEGDIAVIVTDGNGNPLPGERVRFDLTYVQPKEPWRTPSGLKRLYNQRKGNGAKAQLEAMNGTIRLIGTLSASSATSGRDGVATVVYRTSHIASDLSQKARGKERVTARLTNGSAFKIDLNIGWTGLREIQPVAQGLRVIGATGTYVNPKLQAWLQELGARIRQLKWPHPVTVTAASLRWGGQYPPHFTHKHGWTLDLRPMSSDGRPTWAKRDGTAKANYDKERTRQLILFLKEANGRVVFNGKGVGGAPLDGHDNHIHVTWLGPRLYT